LSSVAGRRGAHGVPRQLQEWCFVRQRRLGAAAFQSRKPNPGNSEQRWWRLGYRAAWRHPPLTDCVPGRRQTSQAYLLPALQSRRRQGVWPWNASFWTFAGHPSRLARRWAPGCRNLGGQPDGRRGPKGAWGTAGDTEAAGTQCVATDHTDVAATRL